MQKGQPAGRFSADQSNLPSHAFGSGGTYHNGQDTAADYANGFLAGYEAGRRSSLGENSQQRFAASGSSGVNGQRTSFGASTQRQQQGNSGFSGVGQAGRGTMRNLTGRDRQFSGSRRAPSAGAGQEGTHRYGAQTASGTRRLSDGFQLRTSVNDHKAAGLMHDARAGPREHEMNGQDTSPGAEVHLNGSGRY